MAKKACGKAEANEKSVMKDFFKRLRCRINGHRYIKVPDMTENLALDKQRIIHFQCWNCYNSKFFGPKGELCVE